MSHDELRTEYNRLKLQVRQLRAGQPPPGAEDSDMHRLMEKLQTLTEEYDRKVDELEAQIADLKRELFGPKSDRLTTEQQKQLSRLKQDGRGQRRYPGRGRGEEEAKTDGTPQRTSSAAGTPGNRNRHDRAATRTLPLLRENAGADRRRGQRGD